MSDIAVDIAPESATYGQLLLVNGALVLTQDADARGTDLVANRLLKRFGQFTGEWFLKNNDGTPWYQSVLVKGGRKESADAAMIDRILATDGVLALLKYESQFDSSLRKFSATFCVSTVGGNLTMQVGSPTS